ncbi:MAG: hypothetical protein M3371_08645 [Acidobacteriota bacterium]|nr:hypothetical protein [Acidobacteriota bacterium]
MKFEIDKEMDALLRRHAQSQADPRHTSAPQDNVASAADAVAGAHLDADELSAYAENALPAPARVRYAAHLTDCDECRKIVTNITLANNVAGELEKSAAAVAPASQTIPAAWRKRLSAWLTPHSAWRYALPLVALLVVSGVVLLALLRSDRQPTGELAQSREPAQRSAATQEIHHATDGEAPTGTLPATEANANAAGDAAARKDARSVESISPSKEAGKPAASAGEPSSDVAQSASVGRAAPGESASVAAALPSPALRAEEVVVTQPAAPAPTANARQARNDESSNNDSGNFARGNAQLNSDNQSQNATQNRGSVRDMNEDEQQRQERRRNQELTPAPSANARQKSRAPAKAESAERESAPTEKKAAKDQKNEADDEDVAEETRTVAGRRFRRQGSKWVDTAYKSSQATVVVRRGSEQFRALAADAPELRSIANAFGSEVIVVWQGRAYRIR